MKGFGALYLFQLKKNWEKFEQKLSIDEIVEKVKKNLVWGTCAQNLIIFYGSKKGKSLWSGELMAIFLMLGP